MEQKTKTVSSLRQRLVHGTKWSFIGSAASQGLGLLTAIIIARFLGKEGFGKYGIIQSTLGMFGVFAGLAMGYTATKHVAEFRHTAPQRAGKFIGLTIILGLLSSLIVALFVLCFGDLFSRYVLNDVNLKGVLRLSAGVLVLNTLFDIQIAGLAGLEMFAVIAGVNIFSGVITLPCVAIGVWQYDLYGAVGGFLCSRILSCLVLQYYLQKKSAQAGIAISYYAEKKEWLTIWHFSFPSLMSNIIANPANWLCNILLVNQANGFAQMGLYQASIQWQSAISFVPMRLMSVALPMLSSLFGQKDYRRYYKVVGATQGTILGISLVTAIPMMLCGNYILSAYGKDFTGEGWTFTLVLIAGIFIIFERSLSEVLLSRGRAWEKFVAYIANSVLSVAVLWGFFLNKGAMGLAGSLCIAHGVGLMILVGYIFYFKKKDQKIMESTDGNNEHKSECGR